MNATTTLAAPRTAPRPLILPARHTRASLRATLDRVLTRESRRYAAVQCGLDLCDAWLGAPGFCLRQAGHAGGCLPIPAGYAPDEVAP